MAPVRTCVGCRRTAPQHELVRVARTADGELELGRSLPGRGAYLCAGSGACLDLAVKRKAFSRAFRAPVEAEAVERLRTKRPNSARMEGRAGKRLRPIRKD